MISQIVKVDEKLIASFINDTVEPTAIMVDTLAGYLLTATNSTKSKLFQFGIETSRSKAKEDLSISDEWTKLAHFQGTS